MDRKQYEISNFAKDGHISTHNKIYWDNDEYVGIGAGAHGYVQGIRYSNIGPIRKYLESIHNGKRPIHCMNMMLLLKKNAKSKCF